MMRRWIEALNRAIQAGEDIIIEGEWDENWDYGEGEDFLYLRCRRCGEVHVFMAHHIGKAQIDNALSEHLKECEGDLHDPDMV